MINERRLALEDLSRQKGPRAGSNKGRVLLGCARVPRCASLPLLIIPQILAFAAVLACALSPRAGLGVLRLFMAMYALGLGF
jgi:hypothetical protein